MQNYFGLSKSFQTEGETHILTIAVGTPGYLDQSKDL